MTTRACGLDTTGFGVDNLTITKQNTAFFPNSQTQQTNIPLNNLGPGQDYVATLQADFLNDTTYRISATLSNNAWDEQSLNDEIVGYITPFNLFDPALERIRRLPARWFVCSRNIPNYCNNQQLG